MAAKSGPPEKKLVEKILSIVRKRVKGRLARAAVEFTEAFYARVPAVDLAPTKAADLAAAALSIWEFGRQRPKKTVLARAINPTVDAEGWSSPHTIIEIVNDDMPFLVDSVVNELSGQQQTIELVIHPVVRVRRTSDGKLTRLLANADPDDRGGNHESFMHVEIARESDPAELAHIVNRLQQVLGDVRVAVDDWPQMRASVTRVLTELDADPPALPREELEEEKQFLRWLADGQFTFLGYREYQFSRRKGKIRPRVVPGSGCGILRDDATRVFDVVTRHTTLPDDVDQFVKQPKLLMIGKASQKSTVHRSVHLDLIGVKRFDNGSSPVGLKLFLGLFTSSAYNRSPQFIPVLRQKIQRTLDRVGLDRTSHDGKSLLHILESFPRDDLLQIPEDSLRDVATGILGLQERHRTSLFVWHDPLERFVSCLVYVPSDRHNTQLRIQIQHILEHAFQGECRSFDTRIDDNSILTRIHYVISTTPGQTLDLDLKVLQRKVADAARTWTDRLQATLVTATGEGEGQRLYRRYANAFGIAYQGTFEPKTAVVDVNKLEQVIDTRQPALHLHREPDQPAYAVRFRGYNLERPVPLSDAMPILENLGLKAIEERPFLVQPAGSPAIWIHDFGLVQAERRPIDLAAVGDKLHEAVARVWTGEMEDDGFNRLVITSGLNWRQVVVLRAYAHFLRQIRIPFSGAYMQQTLAANPELTRHIVDLFETLFDPACASAGEGKVDQLRATIRTELDAVTSLDEDRIISAFVNVVLATTRTNYYQRTEDGQPKGYLSFKLDSRQIENLPLPRPMMETFVYSPRVEGVHLRFGRVARGGIRWSDRREDFRTEILGLVKAQQVKNSVIVPVGSKGGFIVKQPPADSSREAQFQEGVACYQTLIRGLLDVTDNFDDGQPVRPPDVACRDGHDPYLVVAADKGTASFSDIANEVAVEYRFWLGDAFASGGSAGYDHKEMGITARGAWESVKRHFRELEMDIQHQDFSVVGVGDMSGDVFGNGMLLSRHIKLIGAFNHLHIFVDPDPDPEESYRERRRLFKMPRSSWQDYDPELLSEGAAVFDRRAKSLTLSVAIKKRFHISRTKVTPNVLIRALLKADVDLLWFGGIGTYVKSRHESHADVGDRANDAVRVDGRDIRARVVGEGANLGLTQRGRVEYALAGGRINTDAVDNSAGVDCSDHEVNIKILLSAAEHAGKLTRRQRDNLLNKMTSEVAELVLRDNYLQTGTLSVTKFIEHRLTDRLVNFMCAVEKAGHLNREIEFLPDDDALADRKRDKIGLARPELCILMAYAKIVLYQELLNSQFPDEPFMVRELERYFPEPLRVKFEPWITDHPLRREIIATVATNAMINRAGITFAHDVKEKTGREACDVARGYVISSHIFDMEDLWNQIDSLDKRVPASLQASMHYEIGRLIERVTTWFLNHGPQPLDIAANIHEYGEGVRCVVDSLDEMLTPSDRQYLAGRVEKFTTKGAPEPLARRIAALRLLIPACDIVRISQRVEASVLRAGQVYFALGDELGLDWLRRQAGNLPVTSYWDNLATTAIVEDLYNHQYELTSKLLNLAGDIVDPGELLARCSVVQTEAFSATARLLQEIRHGKSVDLAKLAVANRQLQRLLAHHNTNRANTAEN